MDAGWNERITALEERECANARGIERLEQGQETLRRLVTAVEVLATKQESVAGNVARLNGKMDALEQKSARRWDGLVDKILLVLAGAFVSFLLAKGGA